jgi:acyl carrier protein
MPPSATIDDRIRDFLLRTFPTVRKTGLKNDTLLLESGVIDSLGTLNIVEFLESSFNITIADDDLVPENFATIETLTAFTRKKIEQPRTTGL